MNQRENKAGFTLIELLLVMLLIAVAAAIIAPSFSGFSRGRRLPNISVALQTTARWCRMKALQEGTVYRLVLNKSSRSWLVMKDDGTGQFVASDEEYGKEQTLPEGIDFGAIVFEMNLADDDQQGDFITFKPGGRSDVVTIDLVSDKQTIQIANDMPLGTFHIVPTVAR